MDSGFHHDQTLSYGPNRHAISFQSSATDSTSEMIMMGDYYSINNNNNNNTSWMMFSGMGNSSSGYAQFGNSCASVLSDAGPRLKHDAGLAVEWSSEEQYKLEEGLSIYADQPSIMRYIKIASTLRDKTVRDVALRCRWMTDKLLETLSKPSLSSISTSNVAPFSVTMNNNRIHSGVSPFDALSVSTRRLLEQNNRVFGQISANISALKLQDNVDLFNHARNNITSILNDMRYMPGPPLPVSLNESLANTIFPATSQNMTFGSSSRMHLKQEPDY
ncbi:uncharacterized protein [Rutidosis leptorrhynchoides]|uniref:uncharacterized protein isoform X2 n=1 Tax=Rutidosis leptorrhynchoides TaxID=125765 RepID=UPI003A99BF6A